MTMDWSFPQSCRNHEKTRRILQEVDDHGLMFSGAIGTRRKREEFYKKLCREEVTCAEVYGHGLDAAATHSSWRWLLWGWGERGRKKGLTLIECTQRIGSSSSSCSRIRVGLMNLKLIKRRGALVVEVQRRQETQVVTTKHWPDPALRKKTQHKTPLQNFPFPLSLTQTQEHWSQVFRELQRKHRVSWNTAILSWIFCLSVSLSRFCTCNPHCSIQLPIPTSQKRKNMGKKRPKQRDGEGNLLR